MRIRLFMMLAILHIMGSTAFCQSYAEQLLAEIRSAYESLNYAEAEIKGKAAIETYHKFSSTQLSEIHKMLGLIYFSENKPQLSREQFVAALTLTPALELDSLMVSPKIVRFFNSIRSEIEATDPAASGAAAPACIRYVLVPDKRPEAGFRSMLLPGWGQRYKDESKKGWLITGIWGAGAVATVAMQIARSNARRSYLDETSQPQIAARFNSFEKYHKLRNTFALFTAAVWGYGIVDAFLSGGSHPGTPGRVSVSPSASTNSAQLSLMIPF